MTAWRGTAPNASPHIERFNRTLREEALNHFIFLDAKHVLRVCREYVEFNNRARPSQALHGNRPGEDVAPL
jgi:hypothetical protein